MSKTRKAKLYKELNSSGVLIEEHEGHFAKALILTVVAALFAFLCWAAVTPVDEITSGSGVIKTQALAERVEHPDGGVVATIDVAAGQYVDVGTRLMSFDISTLDREMIKLRASQNALQAELQRVAYVLEGAGTIPEFTNLDELSAQELLFWAEQSFLDAQLGLIDADSEAIIPTIGYLRERQESMERELDILRDRLVRNRGGQINGIITLTAVEQMEREFLQLQRTILEVRGETEAQRNALEANGLRKNELKAKRNRDAALRRSEIQEQLINVSVTIKELQARIERASVRASIAGHIMDVSVSNPREFIGPGELIAEIIPDNSRIEAEIEISADNIGTVKVGMEARLKVLSYDFTRYGEVVGRVAAISPTSYEDEQGRTVFKVKIEVPEDENGASLANKPILPGMTVTADILSSSKKVLSYLLKPLRALQDRALTEA